MYPLKPNGLIGCSMDRIARKKQTSKLFDHIEVWAREKAATRNPSQLFASIDEEGCDRNLLNKVKCALFHAHLELRRVAE